MSYESNTGWTMKRRGPAAWLACAAAAATIALAPGAASQAQQAYASSPAQAPYTQEELDQMLAPIALYPDPLLAQVLMAATWPLDIVEADRFMRQNPGLQGEALADAVEAMPWDPSVRALTQFPSVLAMMSEQPEWTGQLGDAFLAQREQVMDTVQALRSRARAAGTLYSTGQQQVIVRGTVIAIEPLYAGVLWVPFYDPLLVYGAWWWPAHRPFFWVPPVRYRPPGFGDVHASRFAWGPYVPVRPRLWNNPRPVWRDRYVVIDNRRVNNVIVTHRGTQRPTVWRHEPERGRGFERRPPPANHVGPRPPAPESPGPHPSRPPVVPGQRFDAPAAPTQRLEAPAAPRPRFNAPVAPTQRPDPPVAPGQRFDAPRGIRDGRGPAGDRFGPRREPGPQPRPEPLPRRIEKPVPRMPPPAPAMQPPAPRIAPAAPAAHPPAIRGESPQRPPHPRHAPTQREPGQRGPR